MQGRQNMMERKGPHKSMHCKFCKPPGVVTPEKPTRAQLETKTKIHLTHEAADLRVCNTHNEPGFPAVESEACICVLEGENACPKCIPDKNRPPPKKKVCRCPKGAKPHPSMYNAPPKKKKQVDEDDEFWWEKYSREHDALAKETWAAYMAQRRKDKKLEKCQKREREAVARKKIKGAPSWYQKLSCQQMIYVEYLSTAIRLDSDENITDRTYFVLGGIGLHPRPTRKVLKRCLSYCHYNSIQFLNQLHLLIKDEDPFREKAHVEIGAEVFTWNERLIMNSMCYLEFPALLRELMDRLPPLPRPQMLPQIPYPVFPALPKKKYSSPYEEPIWQDRLNWVEKTKIDRLNRCRLHMETKRVKIPPLALMRRPSLIDARPPFLAQIEANERASRRIVKEKGRKQQKKHPIPTFNSAVDVTAIAGIEASEISTTDKADTEDICVFLREPKEAESAEGEGEGEMEEAAFLPDREVKFMEEPEKSETAVGRLGAFSDPEDFSLEGEGAEDIPFKTPPKTGSGVTIGSPCPPPDTTPGPPALHFDRGRREIDIINEEICGFFPFVSSSAQTVKEDACDRSNDVELNLKSAAEKLKKFADDVEGEETPKKEKKGKKKSKKKEKCPKKQQKKKSKKQKSKYQQTPVKTPNSTKEDTNDDEEEENAALMDDEEEEEEEEEEMLDGMQISFKIEKGSDKKTSQRESEASDPDPDTDDEWPSRPPCVPPTDNADEENAGDAKVRRRFKKRKGKSPRRKHKKKKTTKDRPVVELREETGEYMKKRDPATRSEKDTATDLDDSTAKEDRDTKVEVFAGEVEPLVEDIIKDLAEEGFHCASYPLLNKHPDVDQLLLAMSELPFSVDSKSKMNGSHSHPCLSQTNISFKRDVCNNAPGYLKGEIVNKELRDTLLAATKIRWNQLKGPKKFPVSDLGIPVKRAEKADWNDKKWISRLAKLKIDQFYYKVANGRSEYAAEFYNTLYQGHFGTERYLKIFYAYMPSKYADCILRGIF